MSPEHRDGYWGRLKHPSPPTRGAEAAEKHLALKRLCMGTKR